jgi:hypothetical protein
MFLAAYGSGGGSYTGHWVALAIVVAIAVTLAVWSIYQKRAKRTSFGGAFRLDRRSSEEPSRPAS